MQPLRQLFKHLGTTLHPSVTLAIILGLNVYWGVTLDMFGRQFEQLAGVRPIDLQNVAGILTSTEALSQIAGYTQDTKTLYWSFFVQDNLMPPVVFGSFILLWVYIWQRNPNRLFDRVLNSPFLLVPLGVGFFDWWENLCFVVAISTYPGTGAQPVMELGLLLVRLKAACLFTTFGVTLVLVAYHIWATLRRSIMRYPRTV